SRQDRHRFAVGSLLRLQRRDDDRHGERRWPLLLADRSGAAGKRPAPLWHATAQSLSLPAVAVRLADRPATRARARKPAARVLSAATPAGGPRARSPRTRKGDAVRARVRAQDRISGVPTPRSASRAAAGASPEPAERRLRARLRARARGRGRARGI